MRRAVSNLNNVKVGRWLSHMQQWARAVETHIVLRMHVDANKCRATRKFQNISRYAHMLIFGIAFVDIFHVLARSHTSYLRRWQWYSRPVLDIFSPAPETRWALV